MKLFLLTIIFLALLPTSLWSAEIRVGAAIAEDTIYVGDPFQYQIIIEGHRQSAEVDISTLAPWSPVKAGERDISSERITIFNSRQRRIVEKKYVIAYNLTSQEAGSITLPPVEVTILNKTYRTNPVQVTILAPVTSDSVQLEMTLSETQCVVGQPIVLTVHWYLNRDVGQYSFHIPVLEQPELFMVEEKTPALRGGGKLEEINVGATKTEASVAAASLDNRNYSVVTFHKVLIPQQAGSYTLAAPRISCELEVNQGNRRRRDPFDMFFQDRREYRRYQAEGEPLELEVKALPQAGRPEDFSGLVGQYEIRAEASPTQVNVGDPITLTITISGELLKAVAMPDLEAIEAFAQGFKIPAEQAPAQTKSGSKVFTQTIRVNDDQVKEIPAIPLHYFDVERGEYVTVATEPIALEVAATRIVSVDEAVGQSVTVAAPKTELEVVQHGIAANYEGPEIYRHQAFDLLAVMAQPVYLTVYLAPLALVLIALTGRVAGAQNPVRQREKRRAGAARGAVVKLKRLEGAKQNSVKETALQVGEIFREFVADLFDKKGDALTPQDCRALLAAKTNRTENIERFCEVLEKSENSRYGGDVELFESLDYREIIKLLKELH